MLDFNISDYPTIRVIALSGNLDGLHTLGLEKIVEEAKQGNCHHVILRCSEVVSMDLGGLGNFYIWYHTLHTNHVCLSIVAPSPIVRNTLESVHLTKLIPIYSSIPEAIRYHPAPPSTSS